MISSTDAPVRVRPERPDDEPGIEVLLQAAFGGRGEARLVERLRVTGDAEFALVAENGGLIGYALFSRLTAPFRALALAPVAVGPGHQGRGIGTALIRAGIGEAARRAWQGVFVLGDPGYYRRFGFDPAAAAGFVSPYAGPHFMALSLGGPLPATVGAIIYPPAFRELG